MPVKVWSFRVNSNISYEASNAKLHIIFINTK
jgi:hypothetical protein